MSEQSGPIYAPDAFAGFVRRTLALIIDAVVLLALWVSVPWVWYAGAPAEWVTEGSYRRVYLVLLILAFAYVFGLRLTENGTLGYRIVGIRYAHVLAGKPKAAALAFRASLALVLLWFFALDHIWILFDERKQAWHDKVSGFYVVKRNARPIGTGRIVQRLIQFMMLTFVVWEPAQPDDQPQPERE